MKRKQNSRLYKKNHIPRDQYKYLEVEYCKFKRIHEFKYLS